MELSVIFYKLRSFYNRKLVLPLLKSRESVQKIALGVGIGVFWGLTPTVGFQMYIVLLQWLIQRYCFRSNFDLTSAVAMVWVSNPLTVVPFYFIFYTTGSFILEFFNLNYIGSFSQLIQDFNSIYSNSEFNPLEKSYILLKVMLFHWGGVMLLGSLIYAFPFSFFSYYLTKNFLISFKKSRMIRKAAKSKLRSMNLL